MKYFGLLAALCFLTSSFAFAHFGNLQALEGTKVILPGASSFWNVYDGMLAKNFPNNTGHSMAAGVLATCRGDAWENRVQDVTAIVLAMSASAHRIIRCPLKELTPQLSYAAATLACKMNGRTPIDMVKSLDVAYSGLLADRATPWLPNVVVAAQ